MDSPEADIKKYTEQLAADPKSRAFVPLSDAYRRLGRYEEAISIAQDGVEKHPTYVAGKMALARALFENGDVDSAREHLSWVLSIAPDNLMASRLMAELDRLTPTPVVQAPAPTKTETLAELYREQGHMKEAKAVYADVGRTDKIKEIEVEERSPLEKRLQDLLHRIQSRRRAA